MLVRGDMMTQVVLQPMLKFNGRGHINHFWTNLSTNGGGEPKGEMREAIKQDFGSFAKFKEKLTTVSVVSRALAGAGLVLTWRATYRSLLV